jgi:small ligand-binding sensory domain FIST
MVARTRIGSGLSLLDDAAEAARTAAREAAAALQGASCDLAFVFVSSDHLAEAGAAAAAARSELRAARLVGCVAGGVLGGRRELEEGPGVAVWAASLPGAAIELFHAEGVETPEGVAVTGFPQLDDPSLVALLVDPFSFPGGPFLEGLNQEYPGLPVVGGLAAGGHRPGLQALLLDGEVHRGGAVGAVVSGAGVRTVVSQGCLPVGHDLVITRGEGNVIYELAGRPAVERLREQVDALDELARRKALRGLLVGLVIDENRPDYERGDYLIRGILGGDEESGALVVGETVRPGQTLRFHIRDGASSRTDLREALATALEGTRPAGALVFTCSGRGISMFGEADHDAALVADTLGGGGVAGFFCGGEIGPVGGRAFMHGFTATLAVFLDGAPPPSAAG